MRTLYLVSVWVHIVAAMAWLGGMLFMVLVLVPTLRSPTMRDDALRLVRALGMRFRTVGWVALGTLGVTGIVNVWCRGYGLASWLSGDALASPFGQTLLYKLALVTLVLGLSVFHDFRIGPRATDEGLPADERERYRRLASRFGRTTFALALAIVALAITLVR